MVDLSTTYLGLKLKNPLVASASPLSEKVETAKKLEEAGIAAIAQNLQLRSTRSIPRVESTHSKQMPILKRSRKSNRPSVSLSLAA